MNCPIKGKICHKYKAYQVTEKTKDKTNSYLVCEDCLYLNDHNMDIEINNKNNTCNFCGIGIEEILKENKIGCSNCYYFFNETISKIITNVQKTPGTDLKHKGNPPDHWMREQAEKTNPIDFAVELNQKLKISIKDEDYEKASIIKKSLDEYLLILQDYQLLQKEQVPLKKEELVQFIYDYRKNDLTQSI